MDNLEKIKKFLAKDIPLTLENESGESDIFYFKPLNVEQQAILMELSKRMQSRELVEIEGEKIPDVKKEDLGEMFELIKDIVKTSFPDLDDKTVEEFSNSNFSQLSEKIADLIPKTTNSEAVEKIKKIQTERKNARKSE